MPGKCCFFGSIIVSPSRLAISAVRCTPTSCTSCAKTVLTECQVACRNVIAPKFSASSVLRTVQPFCTGGQFGNVYWNGPEYTLLGEMPSSNAVANVNGL